MWCRSTGQHVTWVLGVAADPTAALHAWVEAAGVPVAEPVDPRLLYQPVLTV